LPNWFEKKQSGVAAASITAPTGPKVPRHSGGWSVLRKRLAVEPGLRVIDVGYTSPTNINFLTDLGHSIFLADLVQDAWNVNWQTDKDGEGNPKWDVEGFLKQSLDFGGRTFDVVLMWTALDYLPEAFVVPVVMHLSEAMNPGGQVLSFFHTRTQGEETAHCRFHVTPTDNVEMQLSTTAPIQRAFTNRSIEKLFAGWSGHRQFLAKDSVSEVIMTR